MLGRGPRSVNASVWIGLAAIVGLAVGLSLAVRQWRSPRAAPEADAGSSSDSSVIDRALAQIPPAPIDSTELKMLWMDEVKGVDVSMLAPRQRELFVRVANAERCTCGCGFTLAACRTYDTTCPVSRPRAERLRDSVAAGLIVGAKGLRERPAGRR